MPTQGGPGGRGPTHCCDTHHTERFVFVFVPIAVILPIRRGLYFLLSHEFLICLLLHPVSFGVLILIPVDFSFVLQVLSFLMYIGVVKYF